MRHIPRVTLLSFILLGVCAAQSAPSQETEKPAAKPTTRPTTTTATTTTTAKPATPHTNYKPASPATNTSKAGDSGKIIIVSNNTGGETSAVPSNTARENEKSTNATGNSNTTHTTKSPVAYNHSVHTNTGTTAKTEHELKHHDDKDEAIEVAGASAPAKPTATFIAPNTANSNEYNRDLVNLNTASSKSIDSVFGNSTGQKVIAGRPYQEVRELLTRNIVPGNEYLEIRDMVTVGHRERERDSHDGDYGNNNNVVAQPRVVNTSATTTTTGTTTNHPTSETHHHYKVDLNKGSKEAIDSVFGHEHGRRVIEARPYKEVHELLTRNVVDEKKYHEVKDRVTVGTVTTTSTASKTQAHATQSVATGSITTTPAQTRATSGATASTPTSTHAAQAPPGSTTPPPAQGTQTKTTVK